MKKRVYIVHGWSEDSNSIWIPWMKSELENRGVEVHAFDLPGKLFPQLENWVKLLERDALDLDENTFFIGHSVGCQAIMRFIEKIHKNKRIGGCIFVAPWFNMISNEPEEIELAHPWVNTETDFSRILEHTTNFLAIFSDNDSLVPISDHKIFEDKLGAKTVIEKGGGHFRGKIERGVLREVLKFLHLK